MLEKINQPGYESLSKPCGEILEIIKNKKKKKKSTSIAVAEIGIGIGATSSEIVKLLSEDDNYYMFSLDSDVAELETDIKGKDYCKTNIHAIGNTRKTYDSYGWSLLKLYNNDKKEMFDIVYLDAAHAYLHDGFTVCLLKKMIKKGGILILDDIDWSFATSPTSNPQKKPAVKKWYTQEQIEACHVALIEEIFLKNDKDWKLIKDVSGKHRSAYKRIH